MVPSSRIPRWLVTVSVVGRARMILWGWICLATGRTMHCDFHRYQRSLQYHRCCSHNRLKRPGTRNPGASFSGYWVPFVGVGVKPTYRSPLHPRCPHEATREVIPCEGAAAQSTSLLVDSLSWLVGKGFGWSGTHRANCSASSSVKFLMFA